MNDNEITIIYKNTQKTIKLEPYCYLFTISYLLMPYSVFYALLILLNLMVYYKRMEAIFSFKECFRFLQFIYNEQKKDFLLKNKE